MRASLFAVLLMLASVPLAAAALPPLYDVDGKTVESEKRFGKLQRVFLFAGLGTPAEKAMLDLAQENVARIRRSERASVAVIFVAMTPRQAADFCRAREYSFPWFCDPGARWLQALAIDFLPTLAVLSPAGEVRYRTTALSPKLVQSVVRHPEKSPEPSR